MNQIEKIRKAAQRRDAEENAEENLVLKEIDFLKGEIRKLAPRIADLISVANELRKNKFSVNVGSEIVFKTECVPICYLGITLPSYGQWFSVYVNGDVLSPISGEKLPYEKSAAEGFVRNARYFLKYFDKFENDVDDYINSL